MRLDGTVIVVTGASSGIGKAMAGAFLEEGAHVACASRTEARLNEAVADVSTDVGEAIAVPTDVRSWGSVTDLVETTEERFGSVDVLVNNAGVSQRNLVEDGFHPIAELPIEVWDGIVSTNLTGSFYCTRAVLPNLLSRGEGRIVHVSSRAGEQGTARRGAYVASKFGLEGLHECLSMELDGTGVSSLVVRPPQGGTRSGMMGDHEAEHHPDVMNETAIRLAAGDGENGGRYVPTPDGDDYVQWPRTAERPPDHPDFQ